MITPATLLEDWVNAKVTEPCVEAKAFANYITGKYARAEKLLPGITKTLRRNGYLEKGGRRVAISKEDEKNGSLWVALTILVLQGKLISKNRVLERNRP